MNRLLIAGAGDVFLGDDAFGVEVARRLKNKLLPPQAHVVDFGAREIDPNFALEENCDAAILVNATCQGGAPGTVYVFECNLDDPKPAVQDAPRPSPGLGHRQALYRQMLYRQALYRQAWYKLAAGAGRYRHIVLVGCEPESFGDESAGRTGLSEPVAAAVDETVGIIEILAREILERPPWGNTPEGQSLPGIA